MSDDYLWDPKAPPDPDVAMLERALAPLRSKPIDAIDEPRAPVLPLRPRARKLGWWSVSALASGLAAAAAALALVPLAEERAIEAKRSAPLLASVRPSPPARGPSLAVTRIEGTPRCGDAAIDQKGELGVGEWLETDPRSRAAIAIASVGEIEVGAGSRVFLAATGPNQHKLDLARGSISARVNAPPRLFLVGTPTATAVDLGCAYTLSVDDRGAATLKVTSGWVSLEDRGRASLVAAGASCKTEPERGPGTPVFDDASGAFKEAIARVDRDDMTGLGPALIAARARDALSVHHLLARVTPQLRVRVYTRLSALAPPPPDVTEPKVLRLEASAIEAWQRAIVDDLSRVTW